MPIRYGIWCLPLGITVTGGHRFGGQGIRVQPQRDSKADLAASPHTEGSERPQTGRASLVALSWVLLLVPVVAFFWLIHADAVNMLNADQWTDIQLIRHSASGTLSLNTLWAQHNENRIFFQNLITLLLGHTTHFDVIVEDYLSGLMLVGATGLLVWAHRKRSLWSPWIAYAPVIVLMVSLVQWGIVLFGFEIGWSLIMLALAATLYLLDRPVLTTLLLVAAIAAAVVGSFSSLQGLLIWPAGLWLLYQRCRSGSQIATWVV
jgi:hypothetical protein